MIRGTDHIEIMVRDVDEAVSLEEVPDQRVAAHEGDGDHRVVASRRARPSPDRRARHGRYIQGSCQTSSPAPRW
jgi:hypothetical protein